MDPNECLRQIRKIVKESNGRGFTQGECNDLIGLVQGLDEWLSRGGFLPTAWQRPPDVIGTVSK